MGAPIRIERGVKQDDPLSAIVLNCVMDWIFSKLNENIVVSIKSGVRVDHLAFADDILLMAENRSRGLRDRSPIMKKVCLR